MTNENKPGIMFWIVGLVALGWMAMGSWNYIGQAYDMEFATKDMSEAQIAFLDGLPAWYTALFAIAVFGGLLAAILFLMRKKLSVTLFIVSFLAAFVNQIYWLFGTDAAEVFSDHNLYLMPVLIVVLGLIFVWYSKQQKASGVLS